MWTESLWSHGTSSLQWSVVLGAAFTGALFDVRTGRIPNALSAAVAVTGLARAGIVAGPAGVLDAAMGGFMLLFPYFLLFLFASGGAGDAKLMGALGTWLGVLSGAVALGCVALAGVVMALGFAIARGRLRCVAANIAEVVRLAAYRLTSRNWRGLSLQPSRHEMHKMPYGPAIFAGVCFGAAGVLLWRT